MSKKLIVVADDFGFSEAYNYGVVKAYKEGVVCTLSLMSNMAAAPHAVKLWQSECRRCRWSSTPILCSTAPSAPRKRCPRW